MHRAAAAVLTPLPLLSVIACGVPPAEEPEVSSASRELNAVVSGRESIYGFLNRGSRALADGLLADSWDLGPRFPGPTHLAPITWREDPYQEKYWRFLFYSLRPTKDLLWAYYATGDVRYRDKLIAILRSYAAFDASRPATYDRDHFDDRHGSAFRAMVLVNSYVKLNRSGDLPSDLATSLRASIRRVGRFLADPVNFEGGFNHGYTEAAALALIAVNFPTTFSESPGWRDLALSRLMIVHTAAVDGNGVEVENSPFYHFYVLTFAYQIDRWARTYGVPIDDGFSVRTELMARYGTYIVQPDGELPIIGSSVKANVRGLEKDVYSALADENPGFRWIYTSGASGTAPTDRAALFRTSGQSILRSGFGTAADFKDQTHVTFNVGKWRNAHNHFDVLGVHLYGAGRTLLTDSGLFSYEAGTWHDHFYGTSAHNTVVVDGRDQAKTGTVGIGLRATGTKWAYLSGWHGLYSGVTHKRSVLVLQKDLVLVVDQLASTATHDYAQTWHVFPGASVSTSSTHLNASLSTGRVLALRQAFAGTVVRRKGSTAPIQGWVSLVYEQKSANEAVEYRQSGTKGRFVTLIATGPMANASPTVSATIDSLGTIRANVCTTSIDVRAVIAAQAATGETVSVGTPAAGTCP